MSKNHQYLVRLKGHRPLLLEKVSKVEKLELFENGSFILFHDVKENGELIALKLNADDVEEYIKIYDLLLIDKRDSEERLTH